MVNSESVKVNAVTISKEISIEESKQLLNRCRQLILSYNMERENIKGKIVRNRNLCKDTTNEQEMLISLQDKFLLTLTGVLELLTESDKSKLIETLEIFELDNEVEIITKRIQKYIEDRNYVKIN